LWKLKDISINLFLFAARAKTKSLEGGGRQRARKKFARLTGEVGQVHINIYFPRFHPNQSSNARYQSLTKGVPKYMLPSSPSAVSQLTWQTQISLVY
jgi:hypothetical protein